MVKILLDLSENTLHALQAVAHEKHVSRTAVIREALKEWCDKQLANKKRAKCFAIFKNNPLPDGLEFQKKLRDEWI